MIRFSSIVLASVLALCVVGCGKKSTPEATGSAKGAAATAGKGLHDAGPVGDAAKGAALYASKCLACHQKDGKAMGGMLGANFVDDKARLAKPDSVLLASIRDGVKGKSAVMPPQKDAMSAQEMKDVLAYVRKTFGG